MKRILVFCFILMVGMIFSGFQTVQAATNPKSDLKDYFNEIKKIEKKHLEPFRASLLEIQDIYLQPRVRSEILEKKVLVNFDALLKDWAKIEPKTPEVVEANTKYLKAYQTMREGFALRKEAWDIEQVESNLLTSGNIEQAKEFRAKINVAHSLATQKLNEASMEADDAMDFLLELAEKYKVKIPSLYLISPSSGTLQKKK